MKHHRSPTHSYPQNTFSLPAHAALALRQPSTSIPTLLSPLRSITNTLLLDAADAPDDFQSNAWVNTRPRLTGLGITYLRDAEATNVYDQPLAFQNPTLRIRPDGDQGLPSCAADTLRDDFPAQSFVCQSFGSTENRRVAQTVDRSLCDERGCNVEFCLDADINPTASDIIGLIPDVNMYDDLRREDPAHTGVNPLDTICSTSLRDTKVCHGEPATLNLKGHNSENTHSTTEGKLEQSPSPRVIQDIMSILVQPASDFSFLPWPSANSPSTQCCSLSQPANRRSITCTTLSPAHTSNGGSHSLPAQCSFEYPNATHPSPVLNAHLGIELDELVSRAERFRNKYPERDIDRTWLSHFAGKLSDRGELLNDFRCYVIGCDQRNKRRDHILVHVGAHIGQRPFACSLCPLRFLRKNECKRHEASHSGFRPYSCDICGQSFVRQDLVKRHVKRTHGLKDENPLGISRQTRKKARLV